MVDASIPEPDDARRLRRIDFAIIGWLCFLFLYGLAWEIISLRPPNYDEKLFLSVAEGILRTGKPIQDMVPPTRPFFDHTPLYTYLIALPVAVSQAIGGAEIVLPRAVTSLFGLGTVVVVYLVARDVRGIVAGILAASLVAVNSYFLRFSWFIHMEVVMSFFMVVGLLLLVRQRFLLAGLAIATAVMFKEIALAFWFVAGVYVLIRHGLRKSLVLTLPAPIAFVVWIGIAYLIDAEILGRTLGRWFNSVGGTSPWDRRFRISTRAWIQTIGVQVIGIPLSAALLTTGAVALLRRQRLPPIAWVPIAYCVIAVGVTFLIRLKEDRWLTAVVPMGALAVALAVDWVAVGRWLVRVDLLRTGSAKNGVADS